MHRAKGVLAASASPLPHWVQKFVAAHGSKRTVRMLEARFEGRSILDIAGKFELSESGVKHWLRKEFFTPLGVHKLAELNAAARIWFEKKDRG